MASDAKAPRLHLHLLRHTSATNYLVHDGDVSSPQRELGHSSLTRTDKYVHIVSDQAAIVQERVGPMPDTAGQALDKLDVRPMEFPHSR